MGVRYEAVLTPSKETIWRILIRILRLSEKGGSVLRELNLLLLIHSACVSPQHGILWSTIPLWWSAVLLNREQSRYRACSTHPALIPEKFMLLAWNWSPSVRLQQSSDPFFAVLETMLNFKTIKEGRIDVARTIRELRLAKTMSVLVTLYSKLIKQKTTKPTFCFWFK